jgi:hypothetical protein
LPGGLAKSQEKSLNAILSCDLLAMMVTHAQTDRSVCFAGAQQLLFGTGSGPPQLFAAAM